MGSEKVHVWNSDGIDIGVTRKKAVDMIERGFLPQNITQAALDELNVSRTAIDEFVTEYGTEEDLRAWESFFKEKIPSAPVPMERKRDSWLHKLALRCGGTVQRCNTEPLEELQHLSDLVDPVTFPGGPLTKGKREQMVNYIRATKPNVVIRPVDKIKRQSKKRKANTAQTSEFVTPGIKARD
jgi:hypothetical protein